MKRILIIISSVLLAIIAIPIVMIVGYCVYSLAVDSYAEYLLRKAAPDAEYFDHQCYEYGEGPVHSYEVHFYKFNEYNPEYAKDWEGDSTGGNMCKIRRINAPLFPDVIVINPEAKRASIEFHIKY